MNVEDLEGVDRFDRVKDKWGGHRTVLARTDSGVIVGEADFGHGKIYPHEHLRAEQIREVL